LNTLVFSTGFVCDIDKSNQNKAMEFEQPSSNRCSNTSTYLYDKLFLLSWQLPLRAVQELKVRQASQTLR